MKTLNEKGLAAMRSHAMKSALIICALLAGVVGRLTAVVHAERTPDASNKIVIMVDASGSYKSRQAEAVGRALSLLDSMSQTKLHRWESGMDEVSIISLDAMPETIWKGSLKELKALDPKEWTQRFLARKDLSGCTDVSTAFNLAVAQLDGDPRYVSKYLFVFSDLVHEPPTKSVSKCEKPEKKPPQSFPWEGLSDVSVSVFWAPADQKFLWRKAAEERGLTSFALYTTSESSAVKINPPPRPTVKVTEEDRAVRREGYWETGKSMVTMFFVAGVTLFGLALGGYVIARQLRRRMPPRPAGMPRPGVVRPLNIANRAPGGRPGMPHPVRPIQPNPNHNRQPQ